MTTYTILQIEQVINYWHAAEPGDESVLNAQTWALACIYGLIVCDGRVHVALADLTAGQMEALAAVLGTQWFSTTAIQEWVSLTGEGGGW